jgi:hypothetical protein
VDGDSGGIAELMLDGWRSLVPKPQNNGSLRAFTVRR